MKGIRKNLLGVVMAIVMVIGGLVVLPEKVNAAVTDTVLRWPTDSTKVTQNFSATSKYVHQGIDISGSLNANIYAAEAGTVVSRGNISGGYGNYLVIQHQSGLFTLYGHLNKYASNVEVNQKVAKGQVVAYMGNTGNSSGVHLHFEVRKVKTLYYDSQLSSIQKNLYNPASFKYIYNNSGASTIANSKITQIPSTISQGDAWTCDGTISSNYNLKYANGYIIKNTGKASMWNDEEKVYAIKGSDLKENTTKTYNLKNSAIDRGLLFNKLSPGNYYYVITARDMTDAPLQVIYKFSIVAKVSNNKPQGNVDSVVCDTSGKIHVQGWAYDPDSKGTSLDIHVYVGGSASPSVPCTVIKANLERKDVNNAYGCGNYHGFNAEINTNKTGDVPVYIYAIDTAGGNNPLLGNKTVNVATAAPIGVFEKVESVSSNKIHVVGWAYDPDTKDKSVTIAVYVGGQCNVAGVERHDITANVTRDDVNKSKNCGAKHGFDAIITTNKTGKQAVYVWAHNTDGSPANINKCLGDRSVNIHDCNHTKTVPAPSCTETLKGTDKCSICGKVHSTWNVEPAGHTVVVDPAIAPTYETTGLTEGSHCSVCGEVIVAQQIVPVLQRDTTNQNDTANTDTTETNKTTGKNKTKKSSKSISESNDDQTSEDLEYDDGFAYQIENDDEVTYCQCTNTDATVISIPDTITYNGETLEITAIDDEAFKDCKNLTKVVIGKNVEEIGDRAFKGCSKLKDIKIKTKLLTKKSIGKNAFKGIHKKAVFKCPKKMLKNYKKWIKKAGAPKTANYKK